MHAITARDIKRIAFANLKQAADEHDVFKRLSEDYVYQFEAGRRDTKLAEFSEHLGAAPCSFICMMSIKQRHDAN